MNISIICDEELSTYPPTVNVALCLLDLGHHVTIVCSGIDKAQSSLKENPNCDFVELGPRLARKDALRRMFDDPRVIRGYLKQNRSNIDAVWTMTDTAARAAGKLLLQFTHIMQISELVEYVPAFAKRKMPLHSGVVPNLARNAACVVVPEYNRAHIQKTWWHLSETPTVLPNKPYETVDIPSGDDFPDVEEALRSETRKVLLYQGVYSCDRNLEPFAQAVSDLGDDYALYMMGRPITAEDKRTIEHLCRDYPRVHDLGFIPAPGHLAFTHFGHIGLLPYSTSGSGRTSVLNALYCAPNKIWEYSRFGLPMIGSDVPGLASTFSKESCGLVTLPEAGAIAQAVASIDSKYEKYSAASRSYFDSVDIKEIVASILRHSGID